MLRMSASDDDVSTTPGAASSQVSSYIEADDSLDDEGYAESMTTSYMTSIAAGIRRGIEEDGRIYAAYGQYKPWIPVDDAEVRHSMIAEWQQSGSAPRY